MSLVKDIEIIGEAASQAPPQYRSDHPEIPWKDAIDMRNRRVHVYFSIDVDAVCDAAHKDLPPLLAALENIVPDLD